MGLLDNASGAALWQNGNCVRSAVRFTTFDNKTWQPNKNTRICSAHFVGGKQSNVENSPVCADNFPLAYKKAETQLAS
ncbi:hypothetical protein EVAR_10795_1 [Eumeta japonica]|uniref:THAP-type domain-containing protein n=1 Tax=Eumeta variegata TaxID=151549 RepID=A0A4C1W9K7_EUMVA|nr:hypothetical protein EVAR_10795_1 [Eumeta japonica]